MNPQQKETVDTPMPLVGYCDPLIVRPGETVRCMVSSSDGDYVGDVVRLVHGDPHPAGPGLKIAPVDGTRQGPLPGTKQHLNSGSYMVVAGSGLRGPSGSFTVQAWIFPTTPEKGVQGIISNRAGETAGFDLSIGDEADLVFAVGNERVTTGRRLPICEWSFVAAAYDVDTGLATLYQQTLVSLSPERTRARVEAQLRPGLDPSSGAAVLIGAHPDPATPSGRPARAHYNGKIDSPRLFATRLEEAAIHALAEGAPPQTIGNGALVAAWDFSLDVASTRICDVSENGHHGELVNAPMRGVTGRNWTGEVVDFRLAPTQYAAIHFHDDDLDDAQWEPDFAFAVPDDLATGVYAVRLRSARTEDFAPFFVAARPGQPSADVAYLAPTLTYLAYANEQSPWTDSAFIAALDIDFEARYKPQDRYMIDNRLLGLYDVHSDGSGVCHSSWRRPITNMRPGYYSPFVLCPWGFNADLHLVDWLETQGHKYDLITDHCLHEDGIELLSAYRVLITGSHPEYWTGAMMDALEAYLQNGGRVMYLGGNGIYWVTAIDPARPHMIEVRRGHLGTRTWDGAPGEGYHSATGEVGGLWRFRGRASQRLLGVGVTAAGPRSAQPYRRLEGSFDPRAEFIFEGVGEEEDIGSFGLVLGGAAGYEIDRLDYGLGTPQHTLLLASAKTFGDEYQGTVEDTLEINQRLGGSVNPLVRADMVFFETPNGGAVFSTGSVSWCGALSHANYENPVARITENVLRRFQSEDALS